jgi:hypothetical protein
MDARWRVDPSESSGLADVDVTPSRTYDPSDPTDWRRRQMPGSPRPQEWKIAPTTGGGAALSF